MSELRKLTGQPAPRALVDEEEDPDVNIRALVFLCTPNAALLNALSLPTTPTTPPQRRNHGIEGASSQFVPETEKQEARTEGSNRVNALHKYYVICWCPGAMGVYVFLCLFVLLRDAGLTNMTTRGNDY